MKKRLIVISALVLALVLALFALTACNSASSEIGEELVQNGTFSKFENGKFENWTTSSKSVTFGKGTPSDNDSEQYLYIDNGTNSSQKKYSYLYQRIHVDAGKIYKVSVDMRINSDIKHSQGAYIGFLENTEYKFVAHNTKTNGFVTSTFYIRPQNTDYLTLALSLGTEEEKCNGRVMFDNVSVQRVDKSDVQEGFEVINFRKARTTLSAVNTSGICYIVLLTLFTVAVMVALYIVIRRIYASREAFVDFDNGVTPSGKGGGSKTAKTVWYKNTVFIAFALALGAFVIRLIIILTTYGMGSAMRDTVNNAVSLGSRNGVFNFFGKNPTSTLAPGEMYILAVIGAIVGSAQQTVTASILIRFINVLADIAVVLTIYFYGRKYVGNKLSTVYAGMYAVLPVVFTMSGFNGTFDSLLVALMLATVLLMVEKKYLPTYFMMTLSAVLDMRAMALAPIIVAYFVYRYIKDNGDMRKFTANRAMIVFGLVGAFVLGYLLTLPVGINQISNGDAFFNFKMLVQQISGIKFFVSDAFNLYGMVAMNNKTISQQGVTILNLVFLLVLEAYVISLYFKNRNKQELILLVSFTLAMISVFTLKVDYTYLFLSLAFAVIYTMISGDRRMYGVIAGYATLGFLDVAQLLNNSGFVTGHPTTAITHYETTDPFYIFFCVLTVLLTGYYVYVTYSITNNTKIVDIKAMPEPVGVTFKKGMNDFVARIKSRKSE